MQTIIRRKRLLVCSGLTVSLYACHYSCFAPEAHLSILQSSVTEQLVVTEWCLGMLWCISKALGWGLGKVLMPASQWG